MVGGGWWVVGVDFVWCLWIVCGVVCVDLTGTMKMGNVVSIDNCY